MRAQSFVEIEDKQLEKYYYGSHYILACRSRNAQFPPGLYGNWVTMDRCAWSGDYHLDYNFEAPYWSVFSSNHVELADPYDSPLLEHLPIFIEHAREYLNQKGAYASVAIGPKGLICRFRDKSGLLNQYGKDHGPFDDIAGQPMFLGMKSHAVFAAMNMILRYHYTYDEGYMKKVYPYLSAVAEFWENYLKYEKKRYVIYDDNFGEVASWQGSDWRENYGDFNPITSLGFLRVFFRTMIEISHELNVDIDRQEKWEYILTHLSDLPVYEENGRKHFRAFEGGHGSGLRVLKTNWIMLHALVYPATNISLGSNPEYLKMIRNDMKEWRDNVWLTHGNSFQTVFISGARVGLDPEFLFAQAKEKIEKLSYPNLWIFAEGGGIETCSGIPGMINEMMLQSHNDLMRIFPVFPENQRASFYQLRTFGAFLISSSIDNGKIDYIYIESEKGRDCDILNPWPDRKVLIYGSKKKAEAIKGEELFFKTQEGEKFALVPEGSGYESINQVLNEMLSSRE